MIEVVDGGFPRDEAHEILRGATMACISDGNLLVEVCGEIIAITRRCEN